MHIIDKNVNWALPKLVEAVLGNGIPEDTRNGEVLAMQTPFMLTTLKPWERVLLCPYRRANPFLFLFDGLSILSSVDYVAPLAKFSKQMLKYSDDGVTIRGHYGARLWSQIPIALRMLRQDPSTRRVVLQIWDNREDLNRNSKDIPCNVMVVPRIVDRGGSELDLTVFNRSNDLFWGMAGANIVQFSFLQEYMARCLDIKIGRLHQISTNLHMYREFGPGAKVTEVNPFIETRVTEYPTPSPLDCDNLILELNLMFTALALDQKIPTFRNVFLNNIVLPMLKSWWTKSAAPLEGLPNYDWFEAARMWWR